MDIQNFIANLSWEDAFSWLLTSGLRVALVLIFAWALNWLSSIWIPKILKSISRRKIIDFHFKKQDEAVEEQRLLTLNNVILSVLRVVIWVIAVITILPDFGIDTGPVLAGLGIVGLALGLASRSLIQDYIAGLFILFEDQYRVGEEVEIAGVKGKVRNFTLKTTILEDQVDKKVIHFIPNSQVSKSSNFSRK